MIDTPAFVQTVAQATAIIHIVVPRAGIREVMGPGRQELLSTLSAQGIAPTGPWFTHHLRMTPDMFDFEIGVPVAKPITPTGRVTSAELPATSVARTILHGSYEGLAAAWPALDAWIVAQGRRPGPSLWETYLTDPSSTPDPASWRTELTRPLIS